MTNAVTLFDAGFVVPAYLAAKGGDPLAAGFGDGRNRIGLKGARFRLIQGGQEVAIKDEPYLDIIMVGANASISRTFYMGKYDPTVKAKPTCFSSDGVSPAADAESPQSNKCATCKQNEKGSKIYDDGKKGRACTFSKRLAVKLVGDPENAVYQLDAKSLSLFGDGIPSKHLYTLAEYSKFLQSRGITSKGVVTRISFDTDSSVPKLYFTPMRVLSAEEFSEINKLANTVEVKKMLEVTSDTVDLSGEVDMPVQEHPALPSPEPYPVPATPAPEAPKAAPAAKKAAAKAAPAPAAAAPLDEDLEGMLEGLL